uniref:Ig-like domain-containing protein n=1 Tax=Cyprinus carpio carpio TaxID=630221 RepID=A0A8C1EWK6_CYPCA
MCPVVFEDILFHVFALAGVFFCEQVFGAEVDMRVKAGDSITLYCDCVIPLGSHIVWWRNCSHEHQPSLLIDSSKIFKVNFPRFSFVLNSSSNSYDLHITNVSVSDEGVYYCAKREKKVIKDVQENIFLLFLTIFFLLFMLIFNEKSCTYLC